VSSNPELLEPKGVQNPLVLVSSFQPYQLKTIKITSPVTGDDIFSEKGLQ